MKDVVILGITGSIGRTALRGCANFRDELEITGASVNTSVEKALALCIENGIANLCITSDSPCPDSHGIRIWRSLPEMLQALKADVVLNGIAGSRGLAASLDVIDSGCTLALANKESVVIGGKALFRYAKERNVRIIPVDSEHSAIDELIQTNGVSNTDTLVITASGGPFFNSRPEDLACITPDAAANHPTWKMGPKISIDSSTLANKGLEVIEAHFLFGFDTEHIEVVVHPQSVVHSMVRTRSGQVYAQMSPPDMVFPIMRALLDRSFPRPVGEKLDFTSLDLTFRKLDRKRFTMVDDAYRCALLEGSYPAAYTVADEVAVDDFMKGRILYTDIAPFVSKALEHDWSKDLEDLRYVPQLLKEMEKEIRSLA